MSLIDSLYYVKEKTPDVILVKVLKHPDKYRDRMTICFYYLVLISGYGRTVAPV